MCESHTCFCAYVFSGSLLQRNTKFISHLLKSYLPEEISLNLSFPFCCDEAAWTWCVKCLFPAFHTFIVNFHTYRAAVGHLKPWKAWQREVTGPGVLMKQPLWCWYVWNDTGTTTDSWIPALCRATLRPLSQHKSADLRTASTQGPLSLTQTHQIYVSFLFLEEMFASMNLHTSGLRYELLCVFSDPLHVVSVHTHPVSLLMSSSCFSSLLPWPLTFATAEGARQQACFSELLSQFSCLFRAVYLERLTRQCWAGSCLAEAALKVKNLQISDCAFHACLFLATGDKATRTCLSSAHLTGQKPVSFPELMPAVIQPVSCTELNSGWWTG